MSMSVNSSLGSLSTAQAGNSNGLSSSMTKLSSGLAINSAADNAAGMTMADQFSAQVREMGQKIMNANDSIGMIQIADGAMQGISDNMSRIRELTLKASSGIMNNANRAAIQKEIDALMSSSNQIISSTSYNGINLLNGADGSLANVSNESIDVTSEDGLSSALSSIDNMVEKYGQTRADLGASQNAYASEIRNLSVSQVNAASAQSQIQDLDFAAESANFSKENLMSQTGSFVQAQSQNIKAANISRLFG